MATMSFMPAKLAKIHHIRAYVGKIAIFLVKKAKAGGYFRLQRHGLRLRIICFVGEIRDIC